jgi:energy-coupling factor transporter ATP-binding protein EcfA2
VRVALAERGYSMTSGKANRVEVPYTPCPPEEFAGRFQEREQFIDIVKQGPRQGQVVMVTGARGSGKSSFLEWARYHIQDAANGLHSPAIKREFPYTPGVIFATYRDILYDILGYRKFGWFRKAVKKHGKIIKAVLDGIEKASKFLIIKGIPPEVGTGLVKELKELVPPEIIKYDQLFMEFSRVFENLSGDLVKRGRFVAILCDDVQRSSEPDFCLLRDLIEHLPPGVVFAFTYRLETESMEKCVELRKDIKRLGQIEINLAGMEVREIRDFSVSRYDYAINDNTAELLSKKVGDPFALVSCFNRLQREALDATVQNFQKILVEGLDALACVYDDLDKVWQDRVDRLSVLYPPLPLALIGCMLEVEKPELSSLQNQFNRSVIFKKADRGIYDFAHASLRE